MNPHLTQRQRDVLERIADGQSNPQIASDLGIGFETVKMHVSDILHELGVESREEAAAWWRNENRTVARVRRAASTRLARAFGLGLVGAATVLGVVAGVLAFTSRDDEAPPSLEDLVAAMTRERHVFYAELCGETEDCDEPQFVWFDAAAMASRSATAPNSNYPQASIYDESGVTSFETRGGHASRNSSFAAVPYDPAYFAWPHLIPWTWSTSAPEFIGREDSGGGQLLHFRVESLVTSTGGEPPAGTNRIIDTYIRADTLMPVRVNLESVYADNEIEPTREVMYFGKIEFVPRSTLPSDFFTAFRPPDFLRTYDEQGQAGEAAPFEVYWLGDPAPIPGTLPAGDFTELDVESVQQQGDQARVTYKAASLPSPGLFSITSSPAGSADVGITRKRDEAVAAGNALEVEGGLVYWYEFEFSPCVRQNDPAGPVCTSLAYAALLELSGAQVYTAVHSIRDESDLVDSNSNPFASPEALAAITKRLVPLQR